MKLSEERIAEFQKLWKKHYGKDISRAEAEENAQQLVSLLEVVMDFSHKEQLRKERLTKEPKGFFMKGEGRTCAICGKYAETNKTWYDKYGMKCATCQKGIDKKQIPASMAKNRDAWYSYYDFKDRFNVKPPTLRKWIKAGILKARSITNKNGSVHIQIFLIKDNKDFLPPKKLTKSEMVYEEKEDGKWYYSEPWYCFVDPFEHLKGYKIMNHMQLIDPDKKSKK